MPNNELKKKQTPCSIMLTLIHNNEIERLEYIRPILNSICNTKLVNFSFFEVSNQLNIYYSPFLIIKRFFLKQNFVKVIRLFKSTVKTLPSRNLIFSKFKEIESQIVAEDHLARKHKITYEQFLQTNCEFLLIFESDAVFVNPKTFVSELISVISIIDKNTIVLIGGLYSIKDLKLTAQNSYFYNDFSIHMVFGHHTNTTVGYLVDRNIVRSLLANWPNEEPYGPIDWLIKQNLKKSALSNATTFIYEPPRVLNGSALDIYDSGIQI
jgi:hypothetical protein